MTTLSTTEATSFPGGSKSRVTRAGESLRLGNATPEDLRVLEERRAAHRGVLNTFQAILRTRTRGLNVTVAQRHKRRHTIIGKLSREPGMKLVRMDDVAGCRLIFRSEKQLREFRDELHNARFAHKIRHERDKYDYIKHPKPTGYRGIHDVYEYDVGSESGQHLKGLYIEIQYRTLVQHAWATAVEVIGFITESQPKFQHGDVRYLTAMSLASEILARAHERQNGPHPDIADKDLLVQFLTLDHDLGLLQTLRGLDEAKGQVTAGGNSILIFSKMGDLEVKTYRDAPEALRALFELERDRPEADIVLVRADSSKEVREAFRNYFSNAKDFVRLMDSGCAKLSGHIDVKKFAQAVADAARRNHK